MRVKKPCTWRMKPSPSKSAKLAGKKRDRDGAAAAATGAAPPMSPPRADPSREWKKSKVKTEHVVFSFMKRRVQPLMARDTLGFEYTGDDDTSRMPGGEVDDDDIVERLTRIFKDMPPYTVCPVQKYSSARPPKEVSSRTPLVAGSLLVSSRADVLCLAG
jgi:hypothetical protein